MWNWEEWCLLTNKSGEKTKRFVNIHRLNVRHAHMLERRSERSVAAAVAGVTVTNIK